MKLQNITLKSFSCGIAACPAIYKTENDSFVIIGKNLSKKVSDAQLKGKIGVDEIAIEIPAGLLSDLNK
jgi:hypothetical protein